MPDKSQPLPNYHPILHALAITGLALALTLGLFFLGITQTTDAFLCRWMDHYGLSPFPQQISPVFLWGVGISCSFAMSIAILGTPTYPRKTLLFVSALILTCSSVVVAALAAYDPKLSPWLFIISWAGLCSIFHRSPHLSAHRPSNHPIP